MSYAETETPVETFSRFGKSGWLNSPAHVLAADFASSGNESHRDWDVFYYEERDGRLFDPVRNRTIVGTDGGDNSQLQVNRELENWFLTHDSGIAVRISPSGGQWNYPDEQVEIYRITYEYPSLEKKLFCSFHQFEADIKNPEEVRQYIFPEEDSEEAVLGVIAWVEKKARQKIDTDIKASLLRKEQALYYAGQIKAGVNPDIVFAEMDRNGFLGKNAIGCPSGSDTTTTSIPVYSSTMTELFGQPDSDNLGKRDVICPACNYKNRRPLNGYLDSCKNPDHCPNRSAIVC